MPAKYGRVYEGREPTLRELARDYAEFVTQGASTGVADLELRAARRIARRLKWVSKEESLLELGLPRYILAVGVLRYGAWLGVVGLTLFLLSSALGRDHATDSAISVSGIVIVGLFVGICVAFARRAWASPNWTGPDRSSERLFSHKRGS